jgi:hypothetical protein
MKKLTLHATVDLQCLSKYISSVVRNAMEGFHINYLTDEQMKELNPIIRNAVYTALYAHAVRETSSRAQQFISEHLTRIPDYWEKPELTEDFDDKHFKSCGGPSTFSA